MPKLTIGNTIKIAWSVYHARFQEFYRLALINSFWIFVPVYGWAKYAAMLGLLARLAYGDVAGNTETIVEAKRYIKPKTWFFFGAGLMSSLVFYLKLLLVLIPLWILKSYILNKDPSLLFNTPFWLLSSMFSFYYFYQLMSRLCLYELPLALDENIKVAESRNIAWGLVEDSIFQLQVIILSFSCIFVLPGFIFQKIINVINSGLNFESIINLLNFSQLNFFSFFSEALFFFGVLFIPSLSSAIYILGNVVFNHFFELHPNIILFLFPTASFVIFQVAFGALFIPFWQSLKAVSYYRLNRY